MTEPTDTDTNTKKTRCCRKSRRRRWPIFLLLGGLVGLAFAIPQAIAAHRMGFLGGHGLHGDWNEEDMVRRVTHMADFALDELDATEEQRTEIQAIVARDLPALIAHKAEGAALHDAFREEMHADSPDRAEIDRLQTELVRLVDEGSRLVINTMFEIREVLTTEQIQMIEEFHGR